MKLRPSLPEESWRARLRRFAPIALAALAPKGVCCLAAYAASGALFGRELCGGAETSTIVRGAAGLPTLVKFFRARGALEF